MAVTVAKVTSMAVTVAKVTSMAVTVAKANLMRLKGYHFIWYVCVETALLTLERGMVWPENQ